MNKKNRIIFGLFLCMLCFTACNKDTEIYFETHRSELPCDTESYTENSEVYETTEPDKLCYVYVCGAVSNPGVYMLKEGARIFEVIKLAGGILEDADITSVNQAETITDGQMIYICTKEEAAFHTEIEETNGRIDLNKADKNMLMTLPGIGSSKADAIISYREKNGFFSDINELKNISGIKDGVFEQIKEFIKVSN